MNKFIFILMSIILTFSACHTDSVQSPLDLFSKKIQIKHHHIKTKAEIIAKGGSMLFFEEQKQLLIHDWSNTAYLLSCISLNDSNNITRFASFGEGPGEFIHLNLGQKLSDATVLVQDVDRGPIYEMNIETGSLKRILDYQSHECFNIIRLRNIYIGTGIFSGGMFALWEKGLLSPSRFIHQYPDDGIESNIPSKAMAYQGKMVVRKTQDRFIFASSGCAYFEILELHSDSLVSIKKSFIGQFKYIPSTGDNIYIRADSENKEGYVDVYTTNKYIYLLYSGRVSNNSDLVSMEKSILANRILVFTWDGEPVVEYETDVDLKNFCVSESDQILYAIAYIPDPQLVSFDLN